MNNILSEKDYQKFLLERLSKDNGYIIRKATNFDRLFAVDREMLFKFLNDTQPDTMDYLRKIYKADLEDTIVSFINTETTKARGSLIEVLKHGIEISNRHLDLMYTKPATTFNPDLTRKYGMNIFSVMEEVWASDKERIDVVIFLNGLAIISFELKCNTAGQSYQDAIYQFRTERNPKTRLFLFKAGCLVNFAMDLEEVYMTTKLAGEATFFLPFNMGNGDGVTAGAGNPAFEDKYSVSYMWEDILTKDTVLDLISKFIFVEVKEKVDEQTGKVKRSENLIFPRYHQLDVIRKVLADVRENRTAQNYLIQHSAGSGKTNSIAWLAHRLTSLHDADNKIIFDNVIIVTDRVVVDRQLQKAIMGMEHKAGLIRVMDDKGLFIIGRVDTIKTRKCLNCVDALQLLQHIHGAQLRLIETGLILICYQKHLVSKWQLERPLNCWICSWRTRKKWLSARAKRSSALASKRKPSCPAARHWRKRSTATIR